MSRSRVLDIAAETLAWELRIGYGTHEGRVDALAAALDDEGLDVDDETVAALVDAALLERRHEEGTWTSPTDHDRLVAAMTALDSRGVVSREDYGATIRDAEAEVREEAHRIAEQARVRGTCTFNRQDAEGAAAGGLLFLSYASFDGAGDDVVAIGREIVAALHEHGLEVEWSGEPHHRIGVQVPDWRARIVTGEARRPTLRGWAGVWGDEDDDG